MVTSQSQMISPEPASKSNIEKTDGDRGENGSDLQYIQETDKELKLLTLDKIGPGLKEVMQPPV